MWPNPTLRPSTRAGSVSVHLFLPWVCVGSKKRNTFLSVLYTKQDVTSRSQSWTFTSCGALTLYERSVKNEHGALNQMHQTSFKSDRSGSSRPWGNESFVLSPDTRMEQSFCRWKRTCATRKQRRTSPTFLTTIWSHLRLTSWNEDLLDIIIVVIVSEDS